MATFHYVRGNKVENALSYELHRKNPDGSYTYFAKQNSQQTPHAPLDGKPAIIGPIGEDGAPAELGNSLLGGGAVNAQFFTPIAKLTQDGYRYYLRFEGYMRVTTRTTVLSNVPFNGVLYLDTQAQVSNITVDDTMEVKEDGIYLVTSLGSAKVYDTEIDLDLVKGAEVWSTVTMYSAPSEYCRTEPILIEALTDDLTGGYCYGRINASHYYGTHIYKVAYYDEDLNFLGGAEYDDITSIFNGPKEFLSVSDINTIASEVMSVSNLGAKKFVVFSGNDTNQEGAPDVVSIGNIYFPLFTPPYSVKKGDQFVVRAIADGFFFKDSDSEPKEVQ